MPKRTRPTDPTLVVGYLRTSTTDQKNGIDAQRDAIQRYAAHHKLRVVGWYEDRGVSGSKPAADRDGFAAAIDALAQHGAGVLLIAKRDRLARDTIEVGLATRLVQRLGSRVVSADGTGNGDGPEATMLAQMIDVFAQYERAIIRARTRSALRARSERNLRVSRWPRFGWTFDRHGRMRPVPSQIATLKRMAALRRRGLGYAEIGRRLLKEGRRPARAAKWRIGTVRNLLRRQNPAA